MNLPNKLTVLRVIMIPFFVFFYLTGKVYIADVLFIVASLTDMLDGKIARKYNLVTNFGKFMDRWRTNFLWPRRLSALWKWTGYRPGSCW